MDFSENRMQELRSMQDQINFEFSDLKLLNKALTHKSYANEKTSIAIRIRRIDLQRQCPRSTHEPQGSRGHG